MPNPVKQNLHVDAPLTDVSIAYFQNPMNFVSRRVFPVIGSPKQSNKYYVWTASDLRRTDSAYRAPGTEGPTRNFRVSTSNFFCDVYSVAANVSKQDAANADQPLDLESTFAQGLAQDLAIREDSLFATAAFATSLWGTTVTGATNFTQWDDPASTPLKDLATGIKTIQKATGMRPNRLTVGAATWYDGLMNHPDIIARLPDTSARIVTPGALSTLLGLDVIIAGASYNTAAEGATASNSFILGSHALLSYAPANPGPNIPSAGYTIVWSGFTGNTAGIMTQRYDLPKEDAYPRIESFTAVDFVITASELGYFFASAVSTS